MASSARCRHDLEAARGPGILPRGKERNSVGTTAVKIPHDQALAAARAFQSLFDLSFYGPGSRRLAAPRQARGRRHRAPDIPATVPVKRPGASSIPTRFRAGPSCPVSMSCSRPARSPSISIAAATPAGARDPTLLWQGIVHELYLCSADTWGWHMAVRTGPAEFSRRLVTQLGRRGYVRRRRPPGRANAPGHAQSCPCPMNRLSSGSPATLPRTRKAGAMSSELGSNMSESAIQCRGTFRKRRRWANGARGLKRIIRGAKAPIGTVAIRTRKSVQVRVVGMPLGGPKAGRWMHYCRWLWMKHNGAVTREADLSSRRRRAQ